ncbi:hypothetical protein [Catenuloplanes atrovinosus]|uniref:Uncharacterized protein n=1 Tax=Catenuloplanes atrovinosus TaxID=137266 RepID=A0AAE3YN87_9ACTN|nr:hypothetical protein [Catenuloplanes atrovinosus]MDR7275298.1 hypothetical protein [Catenuloplanes atrovinosus]
MAVLFDAEISVHYGFVMLSDGDDPPDLIESRAGQRNGLCGAAIPGGLAMVTGLHTGRVPFVVRWHDEEPPVGAEWEDVVEVPFRPASPELVLSAFEDFFDVRVPSAGSLRTRYCAVGMDAANDRDTILDDEPTIDRYLLSLWPAEPAPDAVLRQSSAVAAYWHGVCS